jgi:hypothetical protein
MSFRPCSRVACPDESVATLTFDYGDSMAVLGPLSIEREPHAFDLCDQHARLTTVPHGWQLIRLSTLSTARTRGEADAASGPGA